MGQAFGGSDSVASSLTRYRLSGNGPSTSSLIALSTTIDAQADLVFRRFCCSKKTRDFSRTTGCSMWTGRLNHKSRNYTENHKNTCNYTTSLYMIISANTNSNLFEKKTLLPQRASPRGGASRSWWFDRC